MFEQHSNSDEDDTRSAVTRRCVEDNDGAVVAIRLEPVGVLVFGAGVIGFGDKLEVCVEVG